jgi:hypothetical protein
MTQTAPTASPAALTDIVERLRDGPVPIRVCNEAADEIERLRAALRGALSMVDSFASGVGFSTAGRTEYEVYRAALEPKP